MNYISYEQTKELLKQLQLLKGDKGDAFTYDDFTPEQLAALKGADGSVGIVVGEDGKVTVNNTDVELATSSYVDNKIGDIETILSSI